MFCENCGRKINIKKLQCKKCGTAVKLEDGTGFAITAEKRIETELPVSDVPPISKEKPKWFWAAVVAGICLVFILLFVFLSGGSDEKIKPEDVTIDVDEVVPNEQGDEENTDGETATEENDESTPEPEVQRTKTEVVVETLKGSYRKITFDEVSKQPLAGLYDLREQVLLDEKLEDGRWLVVKTKTSSLVFEIRNRADGVVAEKEVLADIFDNSVSNSWVRAFVKENNGKTYFGVECLAKNVLNEKFSAKIIIFECAEKGNSVVLTPVENLSFDQDKADSVKFNNSEKTGIVVPAEGWVSFYGNNNSLAGNESDSMITIRQSYAGVPANLIPENEGKYDKIPMMAITLE